MWLPNNPLGLNYTGFVNLTVTLAESDFNTCHESNCGYKYRCDYDWNVNIDVAETIKYVTLLILKCDSDYKYRFNCDC